MKIIITTKNLELSESLETFVEKKVGAVKKFIGILKEGTPEKGKTLAEVFVELGKETKHHNKGEVYVVKIQVVLPGRNVVAESRADDLLKAITIARDELKMEIEKYKFKHIDKNRRAQRKSKQETEI